MVKMYINHHLQGGSQILTNPLLVSSKCLLHLTEHTQHSMSPEEPAREDALVHGTHTGAHTRIGRQLRMHVQHLKIQRIPGQVRRGNGRAARPEFNTCGLVARRRETRGQEVSEDGHGPVVGGTLVIVAERVLRTSHEPGTTANKFLTCVTSFDHLNALLCVYYYHPHFIDEDSEAQELPGADTSQKSH